MISFAQNFEDVILNRVFRNQKNGFYIDVGAMDPTVESVTKWFYDQGWCGINVEPNPWFYEKLLAERPRDINLNLALGEKEEEKPFYVFERIGNSTFDLPSRDRYVEKGYAATQQTVRVNTLDAVCQKYATRPIDFLKVDCEGWEEQVLKSADWERFRPVVLIVEATEPGTTVPAWSTWEPWLIENAHYEMVYFDGLNRFYLRRESPELRSHFAAPPNVFDEFKLSATEAAEQSNQTYQREWEGFTQQLTKMGAELAAQTQNYQACVAEMDKVRADLAAQVLDQQSRIAAIEQERADLAARTAEQQRHIVALDGERAELLEMLEVKTAKVKNLSSDLIVAQERVSELDTKLQETRLWVGRLSQEVAASRQKQRST